MPFQDESGTVSTDYGTRAFKLAAFAGFASLLAGAAVSGCATAGPSPAERKQQAEEMEALRAQVGELRGALTQSQARAESLETRVGTLNERINSMQGGMDNLLANHKAIASPVVPPASDGAGARPQAAQAEGDPESGFASDEAVQAYRKGMIYHGAGKYADAILAFSGFLERHPDHPLAGNAQFLVGDSYFRQKELKLAITELERVLTSYDRSPRVADTLRELAEAEDQLGMKDRAARHRHLLNSLFPQSPAAAGLAPAPAGKPAASPPKGSGAPAAPAAAAASIDAPPASSAAGSAPAAAAEAAVPALPTAPIGAPAGASAPAGDHR